MQERDKSATRESACGAGNADPSHNYDDNLVIMLTVDNWRSVIAIGLLAAATATWWRWQQRRRFTLPGPPSLPILGSMPWLTQEPLHSQAHALRQRYGSAFQLDIGMQRYVVCAGAHEAKLLLNTTRTVAGDRPDLLFYADQLGTKQWFPPSVPSNEPFVRVSRMLSSKLRQAVRLQPSLRVTDEIVTMLTNKCHRTPVDMDAVIQLFTRSTALELGFGIQLPLHAIREHAETQQLYACVQDLLHMYDTTSECTVPFPFLRWLLPLRTRRRRREAVRVFAQFQQAALQLSRQYSDQIMHNQGRFTTDSQHHYAKEGVAASCLPAGVTIGEAEAVIQGAGVIAAVSDTTTSTVLTCLACIVYDDALQARIHDDIDAVVGSDVRLPTTEDEIMLPFVETVLLESMRMYPFNPMGFNRRATHDVVMPSGAIVRRGTTIIPFNDAITRDAFLYDDPDAFRPERHLGKHRPMLVAFGYGARSCPGQDLAVRNMMTLIVRLFFLFHVQFEEHPLVVTGKSREEVLNFDSSTLMRRPQLARFVLTPRFDRQTMRALSGADVATMT